MGLSLVDWAVIGIYLVGVMLIGIYASGRQRSTRDYFLGDRQMPWWAAMLSIVATETSAVTFIGLPGKAYGDDWSFIQLVAGFILGRVFLAFFFLRVFYRFDTITIYGFLEKRFGNATRALAAALFIAGRIVASGVRLFAACLAIQVATRLPIGWGIVALGVFGIGYTLVGGIRSVVWTDCILGLTFMLGGIVAVGLVLSSIDGGTAAVLSHPALHEKLRILHLGSGAPPGEAVSWTRFLADTRTLFMGIVGGFVLTLATHGTDQDIVQRMLTCPDVKRSAKSLVGSAIIILPMSMLFLLVGSLLWFLHDLHPEFRPADLSRPDRFFPDFIVNHVPSGVAGLLFAGVFAAALSSLTSALNALSSTTVEDFYRPFIRKEAPDRHYLLASRVATFLWGTVLIGAACLFIGGQDSILDIAMKALTYFYGGLLGVFLLAIFTERGNSISTTLGMLLAVPGVLLLQLRAFIEAPATAPGVVQDWLVRAPASWIDTVHQHVPLLAWPLWIVVGTAISFGVGAVGRQTIVRKN